MNLVADNPDGVPLEKLEADLGWRFLSRREKKSLRNKYKDQNPNNDPHIQRWVVNKWDNSGWCGDTESYTYRTLKPKNFYLDKFKKKMPTAKEVKEKIILKAMRENKLATPALWDKLFNAGRKYERKITNKES